MSHTKLGVSLPDDIFGRLRQYSEENDLPRSAVVARALAEYFGKIAAAEFTRKMDEAWSELSNPELDDELEPLRAAGRQMHRRLAAMESLPWETN